MKPPQKRDCSPVFSCFPRGLGFTESAVVACGEIADLIMGLVDFQIVVSFLSPRANPAGEWIRPIQWHATLLIRRMVSPTFLTEKTETMRFSPNEVAPTEINETGIHFTT